MRPVNYIQKITYRDLDSIPSVDISFDAIIVNQEDLKSYFYDLVKKLEHHIYLYSVVPATNSVKETIQKMRDNQLQFKSEILVGSRKFVSSQSRIDSIVSFNYKPNNIKMIRKDLFNFKIDCFMKCLILIYDLKIEDNN